MHLGNGIICPVTGIPMLAIAGATAYYAYKKAKKDFSKDKIMPATILAGFVFALQMINFAIPATGSSGHIIGGILLAAILGPHIAFLAMSSILLIQSVFFADGGLLALGCNIFNMGFLACYVAYPLLYKPLESRNKPIFGAILASVAALQLGSIAVVAEGAVSGSIAVNGIAQFTGLMQMIHLPICIAEGILTAGIIKFAQVMNQKSFSYTFGSISLVLAGIIAPYASQKPDGLEWSLLNISGFVTEQTQGILYNLAEALQTKLSILSNLPYTFGNIIGIILLATIMLSIATLLNRKTIEKDA